jgi:hypothetical protein
MKTLDEILQEKEYSITGGIMEAVKEWLEQWRSDPDGIQTVDDAGQTQLEFLDWLESKLKNNPVEEQKEEKNNVT